MSTATAVPPRDKKGLRTGFTTGACAAAAAKAATRVLVTDTLLTEIETTLPNRTRVTFALRRCERVGAHAIASIIKDGGDDPDCTHGAELVADVLLRDEPGIEIRGGAGVATVTRPGLGLEVGGPAINPVPRKNITEMVTSELGAHRGAVVVISVPGGEEMAKQTTNARLGLLGGISILGTSGIVQPYSTAAWKASVVQEIDVASAGGATELVLTTGGKSEQYAMALHPHLPEHAFVQVGDFIGVGIKSCARHKLARATVVGMMGKLSKMAAGKMQTHVAGSEVDLEFLASVAAEAGGSAALVEQVRAANTARHVLELCKAFGLVGITRLICRKVATACERHAGGALPVHVMLVDFGGALLGRYPDADGEGFAP
jgi:cobalt-precorrin-5B (C1)-methyltransferase